MSYPQLEAYGISYALVFIIHCWFCMWKNICWLLILIFFNQRFIYFSTLFSFGLGSLYLWVIRLFWWCLLQLSQETLLLRCMLHLQLYHLTFTTPKYFCINRGTKFLFQFEIIIDVLALSAPFEYLCYHGYGFTVIIIYLIISVRCQNPTSSESDAYRRQILPSKGGRQILTSKTVPALRALKCQWIS